MACLLLKPKLESQSRWHSKSVQRFTLSWVAGATTSYHELQYMPPVTSHRLSLYVIHCTRVMCITICTYESYLPVQLHIYVCIFPVGVAAGSADQNQTDHLCRAHRHIPATPQNVSACTTSLHWVSQCLASQKPKRWLLLQHHPNTCCMCKRQGLQLHLVLCRDVMR